MKLFVKNIHQHTAKCNLVTMELVNTGSILDGCTVTSYMPMSLQLNVGEINEIPQFAANGIFGFNRSKNIKALQAEVQQKAPAGKKREFRNQVCELFNKAAELNIEVPVEEQEIIGEYVGKRGEEIRIVVKNISCIWSGSHRYTNIWRQTGYGWERPVVTKCMWKVEDADGHIFMFSSGGEVTNGTLEEVVEGETLSAVVTEHSKFRNVRQTWVKNLKPAKK